MNAIFKKRVIALPTILFNVCVSAVREFVQKL